MIIAFVNSKGGVGKSTLAGSLVAWLVSHGHRVALADCDSQESSSEWIRASVPQAHVFRFPTADEILDELPLLKQEFPFIIADGPGAQIETSRALLMWADVAVIPCKASMFEARALAKNTSFVRQAQAIRGNLPMAIAVLSMVGRGYRLTRDMMEAAAALNLELAKTAVTLRQAYADAPGQNRSVFDSGYSARDAAKELAALFEELFPEANTGHLWVENNKTPYNAIE